MVMPRNDPYYMRCRVTGRDCRALRRRLSAVRHSESRIHTLRFTSYRRGAGHDGDPGRYALHYYDDDPSYLLLERWQANTQATAMLTEAECRALLAGDTDWLLDRRNPLLRDFHGSLSGQMLLPRVILTYRRERYALEGQGGWLALNTDIRTTLEHMDFLDPEKLERETAGQEGKNMLEVFCQGDMPEELFRLLEEAVPGWKPMSAAYSNPVS